MTVHKSFPVSIRLLPAGTSIEGYLSEEINRPFEDPGEPPFRPFIVPTDGGFLFGVVYQHWVADSVSIRPRGVAASVPP